MSVKFELSDLDLLQAVLEHCTLKGRYFSIGERICINQQRGRLMAYETAIENEEPYEYKPYEFSKQLNNKIDFVISKIDIQKII